jgi:hypothetical protein
MVYRRHVRESATGQFLCNTLEVPGIEPAMRQRFVRDAVDFTSWLRRSPYTPFSSTSKRLCDGSNEDNMASIAVVPDPPSMTLTHLVLSKW